LARMLAYVEEHRSFFRVAVDHGILVNGSASGAAAAQCSMQTQKMEKFRSSFRSLIEEGLARGALEPMDVQSLAWALGGILRMFTMGAVERREQSLTALAPTITRLFLHGAAPRGSAEGGTRKDSTEGAGAGRPAAGSVRRESAAPASQRRPKKTSSRVRRHA